MPTSKQRPANDPEDFERHVAAIRGAKSPAATELVKALTKRSSTDERLVGALLGLLTEPPYQGGQSKPFYSAVVDGLAATKRADAREQMIALAKRYKSIMSSFLGEYISSRLANAAKKMPSGAPKPAAKQTQKTQQKDALFAEIVADIANDAPRSIYADMLVDKGDVRGEFIALQLARARGDYTREQAERERTLLSADKHIKKFATPLSTAAEAVTFARGFPVAVHLAKSGLATVVDEPEWGTIEKLTNVHGAPITAVVKLIDGGHVPNLRTVATVSAKLLDKLKTPSLPWTAIDLDDESLASIVFGRMPHLRRIAFGRVPVSGELLAALPESIEELSFRTPPVDGALAHASPLRSVKLPRNTPPAALTGVELVHAEVTDTIANVPSWLAAAPSLTSLELHDDTTFRPEFDWAALRRVLDSRALESLTLSRFVGIFSARFERLAKGWRLVFPPGERFMGLYEDLPALAKPLRTAGVSAVTLCSKAPLHYEAPFERVDPNHLAAIDEAWKPIVVDKPDVLVWPDGEAPQEGWVMGRSRGFPSR